MSNTPQHDWVTIVRGPNGLLLVRRCKCGALIVQEA